MAAKSCTWRAAADREVRMRVLGRPPTRSHVPNRSIKRTPSCAPASFWHSRPCFVPHHRHYESRPNGRVDSSRRTRCRNHAARTFGPGRARRSSAPSHSIYPIGQFTHWPQNKQPQLARDADSSPAGGRRAPRGLGHRSVNHLRDSAAQRPRQRLVSCRGSLARPNPTTANRLNPLVLSLMDNQRLMARAGDAQHATGDRFNKLLLLRSHS